MKIQNLLKYPGYIAILLLLICFTVIPALAQDNDCTSDRVPFPAPDDGTSGEITTPLDCSQVAPAPDAVPVEGTVNLLDAYDLWILVYAPDGRYYPQRVADPPGSCTPAAMDPENDGSWSVDAYFGLEGDPPAQFEVVLVVSNFPEQSSLIQYWVDSCNAGVFEGIAADDPLWELEGVRELFSIIVFTGEIVECGFVGGEDVEVAENSGDYLGEAWATGVFGADFVLTTDNDALFSVLPEIALGDTELTDGTLIFTPAADAFGVAVVTVDLLDDPGEICQTEELVITIIPVNDPPDCEAALADPTVLWPPNHRMVEITIGGITDADSTIFTFVIDSVESDEPENGLGDGNTSPDYEVTDTTLDTGEATQTVSVRAERSGLGDGRTYTITFTVDDADFSGDLGDDFTEEDVIDGGSCTNTITVFVPHDMRDGLTNPNAVSSLLSNASVNSISSYVVFPPAVDDASADAPAADSGKPE
jgi:hypothetical protein